VHCVKHKRNKRRETDLVPVSKVNGIIGPKCKFFLSYLYITLLTDDDTVRLLVLKSVIIYVTVMTLYQSVTDEVLASVG